MAQASRYLNLLKRSKQSRAGAMAQPCHQGPRGLPLWSTSHSVWHPSSSSQGACFIPTPSVPPSLHLCCKHNNTGGVKEKAFFQ